MLFLNDLRYRAIDKEVRADYVARFIPGGAVNGMVSFHFIL